MNLAETKVIDVVVPVYNESYQMVPYVEKMIATIRDAGYIPHVILVDDGSRDNTWNVIEILNTRYKEVEGVRLMRNYGKDNAIFNGFKYCYGEATITIDSDGQHPISMLPEMLQAWKRGNLVINTIKANRRGQNFVVRLRANIFNYFMSKLMHTNLNGTCDYKLLDKKVVEVLKKRNSNNAIYRFLVSDLGFPSVTFPITTLPSVRPSRWRVINLFKLVIRAIMFHTPFKVFVMLILLIIGPSVVLFIILVATLILGALFSRYSTLLGLLNLCITLVGIIGVSVYLKGLLNIVYDHSEAIVWKHIPQK